MERGMDTKEKLVEISKTNGPPPTILRQGQLPIWSNEIKNIIVAEVTKYYIYFTTSQDEDAGDTIEERTENFRKMTISYFAGILSQRAGEYASVKWRYRGIDWNSPGNSSWNTIYTENEMQFDRSSISHTTNGDWKDGPVYNSDDTSLSWKTGGHRRSETFVEIDAIYTYPKRFALRDLDTARDVLLSRQINTPRPAE
jgi:hypothetical protein